MGLFFFNLIDLLIVIFFCSWVVETSRKIGRKKDGSLSYVTKPIKRHLPAICLDGSRLNARGQVRVRLMVWYIFPKVNMPIIKNTYGKHLYYINSFLYVLCCLFGGFCFWIWHAFAYFIKLIHTGLLSKTGNFRGFF